MAEKNRESAAWQRMRKALRKTRSQVAENLGRLLLGEREIDAAVLDEIETLLLTADVGTEVTGKITERLRRQVSRRELGNTTKLHESLRLDLLQTAKTLQKPFLVTDERPFVILVVGVNGSGKTTTIGKLTQHLQAEGYSVLLAAGDTFRAAAVEQLKVWGERSAVPVIAQQPGADSASVIFDAIQAAVSRRIDVVVCDTAGRLQANQGLMDELAKVRRVIQKIGDAAPHHSLLVLDSTVGQNAVLQVSAFDEAVGLTGLILTKLDGSAKAGAVFALAQSTSLPVYFIGTGEAADDLQPFDSGAFVDALLAP